MVSAHFKVATCPILKLDLFDEEVVVELGASRTFFYACSVPVTIMSKFMLVTPVIFDDTERVNTA